MKRTPLREWLDGVGYGGQVQLAKRCGTHKQHITRLLGSNRTDAFVIEDGDDLWIERVSVPVIKVIGKPKHKTKRAAK